MRLTGSFVLPEDTVMQPVQELSDELRRSSGAENGDVIVSRRNSRAYSKVVDASAAELIRQFAKPSTIAMAVARFSRATGGDPEQTLEDALPILRSLIREGLLADAGSSHEAQISESLAAGDQIDGWVVARCIQALNDTELYRVQRNRQWGALKICRGGENPELLHAQCSISREARILGAIPSANVPRVLASGDWQGRAYLVTEWFLGVEAQVAASELRRLSGPESRRGLLQLGGAILDAYADLHELGIVHGDIHARNLLVDRNQAVKLLDFGIALMADERVEGGRGGVSFFFEPEYALAVLEERLPPAASFVGEQYALASLLYRLLSGSHAQDFSLERLEMMRQIATVGMTSFGARGLEPWPETEALLAKALCKNPAGRFPSMREFALAWHSIKMPAAPAEVAIERDPRLRQIRLDVLSSSAIGGEWIREQFKIAPTASVNTGSAGLAFALYQIARTQEDGELLATADAWVMKAAREIDSETAFYSRERDINTETVGWNSLQHQRPGVYTAQALIAGAREDGALQRGAARQFVEWGRAKLPHEHEREIKLDLTLGLAGNLLGATLILDGLAASSPATAREVSSLREFGQELYARLWTRLDSYPPIGESPGIVDTGIAHGWAGMLYASLCWCASIAEAQSESAESLPLASIPLSLQDRLSQLANLAEPSARGLNWPGFAESLSSGWCNGSAGFVFLWTQAYKTIRDDRFLDLAEGAAWATWEHPSRNPSLCCGLTGQAYALLNMYRHGSNSVWLRRAAQFASWAARAAPSIGNRRGKAALEVRPESLYNGLVGLAVLDADLDRPLDARFPLFERE